jgi:Tfp pilus assembly protein PilE
MATSGSSSFRRDRRPAIGSLVAELAITVAIVATAWIVFSAAYGSYVRGSARAEAQALVATAAERQAQFFARQRRYADSLTVLDLALPPSLEGRYW